MSDYITTYTGKHFEPMNPDLYRGYSPCTAHDLDRKLAIGKKDNYFESGNKHSWSNGYRGERK